MRVAALFPQYRANSRTHCFTSIIKNTSIRNPFPWHANNQFSISFLSQTVLISADQVTRATFYTQGKCRSRYLPTSDPTQSWSGLHPPTIEVNWKELEINGVGGWGCGAREGASLSRRSAYAIAMATSPWLRPWVALQWNGEGNSPVYLQAINSLANAAASLVFSALCIATRIMLLSRPSAILPALQLVMTWLKWTLENQQSFLGRWLAVSLICLLYFDLLRVSFWREMYFVSSLDCKIVTGYER